MPNEEGTSVKILLSFYFAASFRSWKVSVTFQMKAFLMDACRAALAKLSKYLKLKMHTLLERLCEGVKCLHVMQLPANWAMHSVAMPTPTVFAVSFELNNFDFMPVLMCLSCVDTWSLKLTEKDPKLCTINNEFISKTIKCKRDAHDETMAHNFSQFN